MSGGGAPGEVLIDLASPWYVLAVQGQPWQGATIPSGITFAIPDSCDLVGVSLFVQGLLADANPGSSLPLGLTDAVEIRIGAE